MDQLPVFLACGIGAVGMYLLLAMRGRGLRLVGAILGLGAIGYLFSRLLTFGAADETPPPALFYAFSAIALAAAGRMITHERPVYSALYFVMVVLSSASVFLLLEAEFMAFALIIVYAGAILITYLFVLMLAQQTEEGASAAEYDRLPREPLAAVGVGFLMLALLGQVIFDPEAFGGQGSTFPAPVERLDRIRDMVAETNQMERKRAAFIARFRESVPELMEASTIGEVGLDHVIFVQAPSGRERAITFAEAGLTAGEVEALLSQNIERVGFALINTFPVSLELAGIILLMAMFGAVVLARKQIELGEDEKREAAGMRRLSVEPGDSESAVGTGGAA